MKVDINILKSYEKDGWLYSQKHPTLPLIIWNYSQFTQYEGFWNEITTMCRGLVTDDTGNVVSKGFSKFFNYSENKTNIPGDINYVEIYDKVDGSYIGLFFYEGEFIVNSKGSFTSDQVLWAKDILEDLDLSKLNKNWTYCFELVVPENRIVCDYGDERSLYFLSAFCDGVEVEQLYPKELQDTIIKFPKLIQLNCFNPEKLQSKNISNEEGYVVKFSNGERCKIKFEEYVRLHRIVTNTTSYDIWRCLKDDIGFKEILDRIPDEFYDWVKETVADLTRNFNNLHTKIISEYKSICLSLGNCSDKTFALFIKDSEYKSYLFSLRNGKDISSKIWDDVKPTFKKAFQK